MKRLHTQEDTVGILDGSLPRFCIGRLYTYFPVMDEYPGDRWVFNFENEFSASVARWDRPGLYEVAILLNKSLCYDTELTGDVECGDEAFINKFLTDIELLDSSGKIRLALT